VNTCRKWYGIVLTAALVLTLIGCGTTQQGTGSGTTQIEYPTLSGTITVVEKYGHTVTDIAVADMYAAGYALGDILTVQFGNGYAFDAPLVLAYDVERGQYLLRTEYGDGFVAACINYGDLAKEANAGVGDTINLSMKSKAGYLAKFELRQLQRTDQRADYASDAVFANFREIKNGNIAGGILYRGSHPTKTEWPRAPYASALMENAGIATVINMSDTGEELTMYLDTANPDASSYYKKLSDNNAVTCLSMGMTYTDSAFVEKIVAALRFMLSHPAPYYVHCNEGKDRTGFIAILLEALMGAKQEEITADYMLSYVNYYGLEPGTEKYKLIADDNAVVMLKEIAGTDNLARTNTTNAAKAYLLKNGMEASEIEALQKLLSGK
jgi:protein tyrosine/serine phosphatase